MAEWQQWLRRPSSLGRHEATLLRTAMVLIEDTVRVPPDRDQPHRGPRGAQ
ncbi:hypothetical protein HBB16_20140 [Pseudonocardia sp. MCCB 268]|nr:hypothetical protein [Pseudonocardia cytotoxica]